MSRAHGSIQDLKRRKSIANNKIRQKISLHRVLENVTLFITPIRRVLRVKKEGIILNTRRINRREANWIVMTCFLKGVIKEKAKERIEVMGRRGRRRKHLLGELKETRGYWKWQEEALDRPL